MALDSPNKLKNTSFTPINPKIDEALRILENVRVRTPNEMYDFVSLFNPTSKLRLDSMKDDFMDLYCRTFKKYSYGIAEVQGAYTHLIVDIDIKTQCGTKKNNVDIEFVNRKQYTSEQVTSVVEAFQTYLKSIIFDKTDQTCVQETKEYFESIGRKYSMDTCNVPDFTAFVLEKNNSYIYKGHLKSGFHLHFPGINLSVSQIKNTIFAQLKNKIESIIPNCICDDISDKPILLYGSVKSSGMEYYRLTRIFDKHMTELSIDDYFGSHPTYQNFKIYKNLSNDIEEYLPFFFTVSILGKKTCDLKPFVVTTPIYTRDDKYNMPSDYSYDYSFMEHEDEVRKLVDMLTNDRATEHDKWLEVGWVLYNISGGSQIGFDIWNEFSKRTNKPESYDYAVCAFEWQKMKLGNYTIRTLKYFAMMDSPERYEEYRKRQIIDKYVSNMRSTDVDFAEILYNMNGDTYKCASIEHDIWFIFFGHRWHKMDSANDLRRKIDTELKSLYINYASDAKQKCDRINQYISNKEIAHDDPAFDEFLGREDDDLMAEHEVLNEAIKKASKIITDLGSNAKRNQIIKECRFKFYDRYFYELVDENPYLLGFTNGVYDMKNMQFRAGRPIDYVSKCTGYDFEEINEDDFRISEIDDFMTKLYPDEEIREWVLQNDATNLVGGNHNKLFVVHSGPRGNNGKSKKQSLIELAFGDYCIHLPTSLVTGKRTSASAATPELSRAPGTRIAFVQEPDAKDVFSVGIIKELTGNDKMYIRALFKDGMDVTLMFKLHMVCNYLPGVNTSDCAFWNRVLVVPYDSVFLPFHMCPKTPQEQYKQKIFPENKDISLRLKELKHVFMWMLIQKYKEMQSGHIMKTVPKEIERTTRLYKESFDIISKFIFSNYTITKDHKVYVSIDDCFFAFKQYVLDNNYTIKLNSTEFAHNMMTKYTVINDRIIGFVKKNPNIVMDFDEWDEPQKNTEVKTCS